MIQAIFFDFNGVIINDEQIHLRAYREVLQEHAVELTDDDYLKCLGMDDVAFTRAAFARAELEVDDETARSIIDREHELHRSIIEAEVPFAPGVITFIKEAARKYELAIVSMAELSEIEHVLIPPNLLQYFAVTVTAEPGLNHKPAPDCYRRALELLNSKRRTNRKLPLVPNECLVIEDAPPGVEAARAAGMRTLAVTNTVAEELLRAAGAEVVTASLADWNTDAVRLVFR
ncbi:MAG TPA: HAD family phosphatase [Pyrinomonadaceae bacterium]|nr:HAD family phosphatase [Pyrinomonadaceae bacterium]